ncbi:MAG TPA: prolipoprotein diacylglyceryl transferase family protein, partial [Chitinophagaceae bacterium]|nr:prolipoprotein diacylglyceryl transferase family protein [Chitinophagaceae bacterium]
GLIGAKIFNALETWEHFIQDPIGSLFSTSGLTFYGGLIFATVSLYIYSKSKKISFKELCDAAAPALILAYGIGRLGCQFAGDGDWGIYNSAYITNEQGEVVAASGPEDFQKIVDENPEAFYEFRKFKEVPHKYFPSKLPTWLVAQNYKYNVNNAGVRLKDPLPGEYVSVLPVAVFPTPIYEFFASLLIFGFLWFSRRKWKVPLQMFGIYLIFNGLERFFVEKIRVNTKYDLGFIQPTQAELISFAMIIAGIFTYIYVSKEAKKRGKKLE